MKATYTINTEHNGIEIIFDGKPSEEIRNELKAHRFRWHRQKKLWYAVKSEERLQLAQRLSGDNVIELPCQATQATEQKKNKFGIQVGDLFYISWGYDQTNVDFFQVVELVGTVSIRVRGVNPPVINEEPTCPMAADRTYQLTREILKPDRNVFIKDNERGDLKRLKMDEYGNTPYFYFEGRYLAHLCTGDTIKLYNSWYA